MKKLQKKFKSVGAAVLSVCLALAGLSTGGYPKSQAATLTYETVYTISDFSTTTNLGMSNVTLDTANYRSGPSSVKFSAAEGSSTSLWRTKDMRSAIEVILKRKRCTTPLVQKSLDWGYGHTQTTMLNLEIIGAVSPRIEGKIKRDILIKNLAEYDKLIEQLQLSK